MWTAWCQCLGRKSMFCTECVAWRVSFFYARPGVWLRCQCCRFLLYFLAFRSKISLWVEWGSSRIKAFCWEELAYNGCLWLFDTNMINTSFCLSCSHCIMLFVGRCVNVLLWMCWGVSPDLGRAVAEEAPNSTQWQVQQVQKQSVLSTSQYTDHSYSASSDAFVSFDYFINMDRYVLNQRESCTVEKGSIQDCACWRPGSTGAVSCVSSNLRRCILGGTTQRRSDASHYSSLRNVNEFKGMLRNSKEFKGLLRIFKEF